MPKAILICFLLLTFVFNKNAYADCHEITINGAGEWLPISYRDEGGKLNGVAVRVIEEVAQALNLKVNYAAKLGWSEQLEQLEKNEFDIITAAYFNEERAKKFLYSKPFFENQARVFVRRDKAFKIMSLNDLKGRKGGRPHGGSFGEKFDQFDKDHLRMIEIQTSPEKPLMIWLKNGNVDYVIADQLDGRLSIRQLRFTKLIKALPYTISVNDVHFIFSRNSKCASKLNQINIQIEKMKSSGHIKQIVEEELGELIK